MQIIHEVGYVYQIRCTANGKLYIGSTIDPENRIRAHWKSLKRGNHHSIKLQRAYNKYGRDAFVFEILLSVPVAEMLCKEQETLDAIGVDNSYNTAADVRASALGRKASDETRMKMSLAKRGEGNSNYRGRRIECPVCGTKFRPDSNKRKYCSQQCYHQAPKSDEYRQKQSAKSKGRKRSKQAVKKGSAKRANWYIFTSPDGAMQFVQGLMAFCHKNGLDQPSISKVIAGKKPSHKGWKCARL